MLIFVCWNVCWNGSGRAQHLCLSFSGTLEAFFGMPLCVQATKSRAEEVQGAIAASTSATAASIPAPRSASDIKAGCRKLKSQPSELAAYIASVPPGSYKKVLKSDMDSGVLGLFATALQQLQASDAGWCRAALQALQSVDRYKMASAMAAKETRQVLADVAKAVA